MVNYDKGKELEDFVHYVYANLIKINGSKARISKRTTLPGRSGSTNEFDIYYEFDHIGILHKVAIECKNHDRAISVKEVRDFIYKIQDVGNTIGIMVSKNGYQDGAKNVANHDYIKLITIDELPTLTDILAMQIGVLLPDENIVGTPFWVIMESNKRDEVTGSYMTIPNTINSEYDQLIPLYLSKYIAELHLEAYDDDCVVRGVSQMQLKALLALSKSFNIAFVEFFLEPDETNKNMGFLLRPEDLEKKYIIE